MSKDKYSVNIQINNLTLSQVLAIEDLMATWENLGQLGCSRWTNFYADGDGNFRPKILFNGSSPEPCKIVGRDLLWEGSTYKMDFDLISMLIRNSPDYIELTQKKLSLTLFQKLRIVITQIFHPKKR